MNPMAIMKVKGLMDKFKENHPKVPMFFSAASKSITAGSVIEITVTSADGKQMCTNMKVTEEDLELFAQLKDAVN